MSNIVKRFGRTCVVESGGKYVTIREENNEKYSTNSAAPGCHTYTGGFETVVRYAIDHAPGAVVYSSLEELLAGEGRLD